MLLAISLHLPHPGKMTVVTAPSGLGPTHFSACPEEAFCLPGTLYHRLLVSGFLFDPDWSPWTSLTTPVSDMGVNNMGAGYKGWWVVIYLLQQSVSRVKYYRGFSFPSKVQNTSVYISQNRNLELAWLCLGSFTFMTQTNWGKVAGD